MFTKPISASLKALLVVAVLVLLLGLSGLVSLPVTDRDEARYAQASKQMVESGDYVRIRFLDTDRSKKPAGIYWLQAAAVHLTGVKDEIWPYRLVSVVGAFVAVLLIFAMTRLLLSDSTASPWPAVALAASPLLVCVMHAATTDCMLLATVCAAQCALANIYLATRKPDGRPSALAAYLFWIAIGVGLLIKGPLTPLIAGLTILALCLHDREARWLRQLRPITGFLLMILMILPWLLAIQHATNGAFLRESVGHDFLGKVKGGQESHGAPPGMYLLAVSALFWPLFPLAWRGIRSAWLARRTDATAAFLLAWLIPSWLVFELVPTKLPHYVLPLYPALAFLALRKTDNEPSGNRWWRVSCRVVDAAWWICAVVFVAGPLLAALVLGREALPAALVCALVAGGATIGMHCLRRSQAPRHQHVALAAVFALIYFGLLFGAVLPQLDELWLTRNVAAMVAKQTHGQPAQVVSVGYDEPSVAFSLGTQTKLGGGAEGAVEEMRRNPKTIVLIQDAPTTPVGDLVLPARLVKALSLAPNNCYRERFLAAAATSGLMLHEAGSVEGWNYSRTKRVRVILFTCGDATP